MNYLSGHNNHGVVPHDRGLRNLKQEERRGGCIVCPQCSLKFNELALPHPVNTHESSLWAWPMHLPPEYTWLIRWWAQGFCSPVFWESLPISGYGYIRGNTIFSLQPTLWGWRHSKKAFSQVAKLVASQNPWSHLSSEFSCQGICYIMSTRSPILPPKVCSIPLYLRGYIPRPQWVPETVNNSTKP